jgi:hypothetical protein
LWSIFDYSVEYGGTQSTDRPTDIAVGDYGISAGNFIVRLDDKDCGINSTVFDIAQIASKLNAMKFAPDEKSLRVHPDILHTSLIYFSSNGNKVWKLLKQSLHLEKSWANRFLYRCVEAQLFEQSVRRWGWMIQINSPFPLQYRVAVLSKKAIMAKVEEVYNVILSNASYQFGSRHKTQSDLFCVDDVACMYLEKAERELAAMALARSTPDVSKRRKPMEDMTDLVHKADAIRQYSDHLKDYVAEHSKDGAEDADYTEVVRGLVKLLPDSDIDSDSDADTATEFVWSDDPLDIFVRENRASKKRDFSIEQKMTVVDLIKLLAVDHNKKLSDANMLVNIRSSS